MTTKNTAAKLINESMTTGGIAHGKQEDCELGVIADLQCEAAQDDGDSVLVDGAYWDCWGTFEGREWRVKLALTRP